MTDDEIRARWDKLADQQEQLQIDRMFHAMMITEHRARSIKIMLWLLALEVTFIVVALVYLAIQHL